MCLSTDLGDVLAVVVVDVGVDTEQAAEDVLDDVLEVAWERHVRVAWEVLLIVDVAFGPHHDVRDVLVGWKHCRLLVLVVVLPEIFVAWAGGHFHALIARAELGNWCVEA